MNIPFGFTLSNQIDVSATHQPYLIRAIQNTDGDVLELGTGFFSTDLIHHMLINTSRKIVSVEDNENWMSKFSHNKSTNHDFYLIERSIESWTDIIDEYSKRTWGVVFVDQGYGEEIWRPTRNYAVRTLVNCCDFVVAHDADIFPEMKSQDYNWIECIPSVSIDGRLASTYVFSKTKSKGDLERLFLEIEST